MTIGGIGVGKRKITAGGTTINISSSFDNHNHFNSHHNNNQNTQENHSTHDSVNKNISSRIIVKNLPKYITADRLKSHFSSRGGQITDTKLIHAENGRFRQFAYIGFSSSTEAFEALNYFNNTFIDTRKIQVESALATGDSRLERPWSRYSRGSSAFTANQQAFEARIQRQNAQKQLKEEMRKKRQLLMNIFDEEKNENDKNDKSHGTKASINKNSSSTLKDSKKEKNQKDPQEKIMEKKNFLKVISKKPKIWENDLDFDLSQDISSISPPSHSKENRNKPQVSITAVKNKKRGGDGALVSKSHVTFYDETDEIIQKNQNQIENRNEDFEFDSFPGDHSENEEFYQDNFGKFLREKQEFNENENSNKDKNENSNNIGNENIQISDSICNSNVSIHINDDIQTQNQNENQEIKKSESKGFKRNHQNEKLDPSIIYETGKLFLRNLSYSCTESDLRSLFEPFGLLTEIHMPVSSETKIPKGFAYILFMIPENAFTAYQKLDGTIFQGRLLHILPAKEKPDNQTTNEQGKRKNENNKESTFQREKEKKLKSNSLNSINWNSLFIRADTVLEAISHRLGISKTEIMNPDSHSFNTINKKESSSHDNNNGDNDEMNENYQNRSNSTHLAVRMALAETQIIQETKEYLEREGVILDQFDSSRIKERSDTIIMVKNLSFFTESHELRKLFSRFGSVGRVILPPSTKAIALVEFLEPSEARIAFKSLAYTKFKNAPLFLEWAPIEVLNPLAPTSSPLAPSTLSSASVKDSDNQNENEKNDQGEEKEKEKEFHLSSNTLHITNLNFSTQTHALKEIFSACGQIRTVTIPKNKKGQSLGFGFVEFVEKESVNRSLDTLQGTLVDDHKLVLGKSKSSNSSIGSLSLSQMKSKIKKDENDSKRESLTESEQSKTKIIVRNVPFEANLMELKDLFQSFSSIKKIRLPRRYNGQHRGFAFIEFITNRDAKMAMDTLRHTHFYGRHLVLEWAKAETDDEVEKARVKAASVLTRQSFDEDGKKKGKIRIDDQDSNDQEEDGGNDSSLDYSDD